MICPHCNQNVLYKERSGKKCSKCSREFAFEPKTDSLGLHDVRFRKAIAKLSADGKVHFTAGQLQHFLSRKKIKNSFSQTRGFLIFAAIVAVVVNILLAVFSSFSGFLLLALVVAIVSVVILSVVWRTEGNLSLPVGEAEFETNVLRRWQSIYRQLPPTLVTKNLLPNQSVAENARGALVCSEPEILSCLTANRTAENLGLILLNPYTSEPDKLDFVRRRRELPVFVLHDASAEGCSLKDAFVRKQLGNDRSRRVYDVGLRPKTAIKFNLMRLREKKSSVSLPNLPELAQEEIAWLNAGNYTPLLALTPTQLTKLVTNAVTSRSRTVATPIAAKTDAQNEQNAAQAVGFMTWLGK